ncbi:hypothetical protein E2C01_000238 [Portunus trituberculatus]|uniref:Uncharacterized protein n=1 Tax=Portunus trituberculatus TaxID=210409 RepID=A0A5B7CJ37_PORTR|nr:hypothetical protein [Portunus trituberculatus]
MIIFLISCLKPVHIRVGGVDRQGVAGRVGQYGLDRTGRVSIKIQLLPLHKAGQGGDRRERREGVEMRAAERGREALSTLIDALSVVVICTTAPSSSHGNKLKFSASNTIFPCGISPECRVESVLTGHGASPTD